MNQVPVPWPSRDPNDPWGDDGLIFEQQAQENIITWMNDLTKDYAGNIASHRDFFNGLTDIKQVITYGHSMGEVDWPYFEEIIKIVGVNVPWRVSCFSADDINNTHAFQGHFGLKRVIII